MMSVNHSSSAKPPPTTDNAAQTVITGASMEFATKADIARLEAGQAKVLALLQELVSQRTSSASSFRDSAFDASSRGSPGCPEASTETPDIAESIEQQAVCTEDVSGDKSFAIDEAAAAAISISEDKDSGDEKVASVKNIAEIDQSDDEEAFDFVEVVTESSAATTLATTEQLTIATETRETHHVAGNTAIAQKAAQDAFPILMRALHKADTQHIYAFVGSSLPLPIEGTDADERITTLTRVHNTLKQAKLRRAIFQLRDVPNGENNRVTVGITLARFLSCAIEHMLTSSSKSVASLQNKLEDFRLEINMLKPESPPLHEGPAILEGVLSKYSAEIEDAAAKTDRKDLDNEYAIYKEWKAKKYLEAKAWEVTRATEALKWAAPAQVPRLNSTIEIRSQTEDQALPVLPLQEKAVIEVPPHNAPQDGQGLGKAESQTHEPQLTADAFVCQPQAQVKQQAEMASTTPPLHQSASDKDEMSTKFVTEHVAPVLGVEDAKDIDMHSLMDTIDHARQGVRKLSMSSRVANERVCHRKVEKRGDQGKKHNTFKNAVRQFFRQILQEKATQPMNEALPPTQQQDQQRCQQAEQALSEAMNTPPSQSLPAPPSTSFNPHVTQPTTLPAHTQNTGTMQVPTTCAPASKHRAIAPVPGLTQRRLRQRPRTLCQVLPSPRQLLTSLGELRHSARLRHLGFAVPRHRHSLPSETAVAPDITVNMAVNGLYLPSTEPTGNTFTVDLRNPIPTDTPLADAMAQPSTAADSAPSNVWIGPKILAGGSTSFAPARYRLQDEQSPEATASAIEGTDESKSG
ncbi:hypothetical protein NX059_001870 [Plenodomus lindquistii]|nr:hypothetical protein NX059_001870 [Plenodomus lindquistii]